MSPFIFYDLTYKEARLALEGYESEQKQLYYYNYYATFNAVGQLIGGKKFKPIDLFEDESNESKKDNKITQEQKDDIINMFKQHEKNKVV